MDKESILEELKRIHTRRCELLGIDLFLPENLETPARCAKADMEHFHHRIPLQFTVFENQGYDQMIVKPSIPFSSLCQHHLYPYFGVCHIGYVPKAKVCGLSKLSRLVTYKAKGASSQEWLTQEIANYLQDALDPEGVIVVMKAKHTCEMCRGVRNDSVDSTFITSVMKGVFHKSQDQSRMEFFQLIK